MTKSFSPLSTCLVLACASVACTSTGTEPTDLSVPEFFDARDLPMFDGDTAAKLSWIELQDRVEAADIIIVGEQHTDHFGHLFQHAVVESVLGKYEHSAVSLEMLERDEQSFVNDYLVGIITREQFLRRAPIAWKPGATWLAWYQGVIESARIHGREVIAANAPRRYVHLAKTGGYEALRALQNPSAGNFTIEEAPSTGGYAERYRSFFMGGHGIGEEVDDAALTPEQLEAKEEGLRASFRSQSLWDSTMAASIVMGHQKNHGKVVHLVGQFHSDFDGGLLQQIRYLSGDCTILVISMQPRAMDSLHLEDEKRADVVVYTARR